MWVTSVTYIWYIYLQLGKAYPYGSVSVAKARNTMWKIAWASEPRAPTTINSFK